MLCCFFVALYFIVALYVLQDSQSKLFTPAIPRPSPDGGRENEDTDPGGNGKDTVRFFCVKSVRRSKTYLIGVFH